jgi:diamine N-acetyltransferase
MMPLIRPALPGDVPTIVGFVRELAEYEKLSHEAKATDEDLQEALFCAHPRVFCEIAERHGEAVGFSLWYYTFSTFRGRHGIYLEDLYVRPAHRGHGLGKLLLANLAKRCVAESLGRLEWSVLDWNAPSIDFYKSQGAVLMDEWTTCRVTDAALWPLVAVVAAAENGVIGRDNGLVWRLSTDLQRFKALTMGKPMIVGRRTYAAIGRPLPGRTMVVLTRDPGFPAPAGGHVVHTPEEAVRLARRIAAETGAGEVIVGGGAEVYRLLMPQTQRVHLTLVHARPQGDALFDPLDPAVFEEVSREDHPAGPRDEHPFTFVEAVRRSPAA